MAKKKARKRTAPDATADKTPKVMKIKRDRIRADVEIQSRVQLDNDLIAEYASDMADGCKFPPVDLFYDGQTYWLADGFHRLAAYQSSPDKAVAAIVHRGDRRDAVLFAIKANVAHGMRRTNADKRRGVERILTDEKWAEWSDAYIARQCGVSNRFVGEIRASIFEQVKDAHLQECADAPPKKTEKNNGPVREVVRKGTTYTMKVGGIGKGKEGSPRQSRSKITPFVSTAGTSNPDPRTAIELSHDPKVAAVLLVTVFGIPYLEELVKALTEQIKQEQNNLKGT